MGRPLKFDKKIPLSVKLPPYLIAWMDRQSESRAVLIEVALCSYYQIPVQKERDAALKLVEEYRNALHQMKGEI